MLAEACKGESDDSLYQCGELKSVEQLDAFARRSACVSFRSRFPAPLSLPVESRKRRLCGSEMKS